MTIKKFIVRLITTIIIAQLSNIIYAQTPIARFDVVPFQRIDAGETLNVGVIAFSKSGIDRVEFTVKGQGYVGVNPLVSNKMTNNPTTGVYEYWVPVKANDFISDGSIEVEAIVFGKDGSIRNKNWLINNSIGSPYTVNNWHIVDGTHYEYWCSITGTGLFNKDMVFSNAIIYDQTDSWWNGITVNIKSADANIITFKYGDSYGASPVTLDYQPKNGDGFILSRGFGLDPLVLQVNPLGTLPQPVAYVDNAGADGTGVVNSPEKPFATTGGAMVAIRNWMNSNGYGNQINGGVIKLNPGTHTQSNGGYWGSILSKNEWVTFTSNPEKGGSKENTFITGSGMVQTQFVKVEDLSIVASDVLSNVFSVSSSFYPIFKLWIEDCNLEGTTKYNEDTSPVSSSFVWYTNSYFTNMGKAISEAQLARNLTIEHIGDDAFVRSPFVVNCRAFDIDPRDGACEGGNCAHADCWQWWGTPVPHNMIIYGFDCADCTYQGIFARTMDGTVPVGNQNPPADGVAIVNLHTKLIDPASFADNAWCISANHMLLWHNTFNQAFSFWCDGDIANNKTPLNIVDFDVRGNCFYDMELNAPVGDDNGGDPDATGIDTSSWAYNHYEKEAGSNYFIEAPGHDASTGDPMLDENGMPMQGSPIINRMPSILVLTDAKNNIRDNTPDIGSFEYEALSQIGELDNQQVMYVFPNPAKNILNIKSDTHVSYTLMHLTGQAILSGSCTVTKQIDLSGISAGIYFMVIESDGFKTTYKIIKQ